MEHSDSAPLLGYLEAQFAQHDSAPALLEIRKVPFVIGRAGPDGFVDSKQKPNMVSRQHCQFVRVDSPADGAPAGSFAIKLVDLESRNGTVVQSRRVSSVVLRDGDLISFGGASAVDMGGECQGYSDVAYKFRYPSGHPVVPISQHTAQPLAPKAAEPAPAKATAKGAAKAKAAAAAAEAKEKPEKPAKPERGKAKPAAAPAKRAAKAAAKKVKKADATVEYEKGEEPEEPGRKTKRGVTDGLGDLDSLIVVKRPRNASANAAHTWKVGDLVEAKCQNPALKERNAWFDAIICAVNGAQRGYRVQYQGYDHAFDEDLTPAHVRPQSNGEYDISDVTEGQTVLCRHKNGWWYDAKVLRLLQDGEANPDPAKPLFQVRWVDPHVPPPSEVNVSYEHTFMISQ